MNLANHEVAALPSRPLVSQPKSPIGPTTKHILHPLLSIFFLRCVYVDLFNNVCQKNKLMKLFFGSDNKKLTNQPTSPTNQHQSTPIVHFRCTLIYLHGCSCNAGQYLEDGWELPWTGKDYSQGGEDLMKWCGFFWEKYFLVGWMSFIVGDLFLCVFVGDV